MKTNWYDHILINTLEYKLNKPMIYIDNKISFEILDNISLLDLLEIINNIKFYTNKICNLQILDKNIKISNKTITIILENN